MRSLRMLGALAVATVLVGGALPAQAQAQTLVTGRHWQASTLDERRAYLMGLSNLISVGALYDTRAGASSSFSQKAQIAFSGADLGTAVASIDAWYRSHPSDIDKPVVSVLWAYVARQAAYAR